MSTRAQRVARGALDTSVTATPYAVGFLLGAGVVIGAAYGIVAEVALSRRARNGKVEA